MIAKGKAQGAVNDQRTPVIIDMDLPPQKRRTLEDCMRFGYEDTESCDITLIASEVGELT